MDGRRTAYDHNSELEPTAERNIVSVLDYMAPYYILELD